MNHSSARRSGLGMFVGVIGMAGLCSSAGAQIAKLGAMGDSLTDEYAEETYNYAKNWLEQLEVFRSINVGPTAAEAGQAGGTWNEPRRRFFKHNWARSGASTSTVISGGQHTGLAGQFVSDGVSHAVLLIGANDFSPTTAAFFNIYNGIWSQTTINNYVNGRLNNMNTIINTVSGAGVNLAVSNFVDYSVSPLTRVLFPDPVRRERVSTVIRQVNDGIEGICRNRKLPMVDVYGLSTAIFGTNLSLRPFLFIGGQDVNLNDQDTTSNTKKLAGFVHDGVHPHTTLQGVFSNVFMTCANIAWQGSYVPFTEQEILSHAGVAYLGIDELPAQIGDYAQYVVNFACLADFDKSGFVDSDDFDSFVRAFEDGETQADYDGSGFVDTDDFDAFVEGFELGC